MKIKSSSITLEYRKRKGISKQTFDKMFDEDLMKIVPGAGRIPVKYQSITLQGVMWAFMLTGVILILPLAGVFGIFGWIGKGTIKQFVSSYKKHIN